MGVWHVFATLLLGSHYSHLGYCDMFLDIEKVIQNFGENLWCCTTLYVTDGQWRITLNEKIRSTIFSWLYYTTYSFFPNLWWIIQICSQQKDSKRGGGRILEQFCFQFIPRPKDIYHYEDFPMDRQSPTHLLFLIYGRLVKDHNGSPST